ncbi:MAG: RNA polymerase sigma factor [Thermoanaerobaculia bacterium]|nr:RNA polymerase sigma factor [Thermoanaerobaculia bacterium]
MTATAVLLRRFERRRDDATFRALYRAATPRLWGLALRLTGGRRDEAEELVQEAWIRAVERLGSFARRSSFTTWLCAILVNCHREELRRGARAWRSVEPDSVAGEIGGVTPFPGAHRAARIDVERALAALPGGYREVMVLHDLYGYTHREIAATLEIAEGTSKSQLARARARLRELLASGAAPARDRDDERGRR